QERVQACGTDPRVEGLLVDYRHFYGDFDTVATNRHWYRREVRCVRLDRDIRSYQCHEPALVPPRGTMRAARPGYPLLPGRAGLPGRVRAAAGAGAGDRRPDVPLRLGRRVPVAGAQARGVAEDLHRGRGAAGAARRGAAGWGSRVDPPAAAVRGHASSSRPGLDRRAALFARSARRGPTTPPARAPPPLRVGLDRAP